jgi:chaperonin GroES
MDAANDDDAAAPFLEQHRLWDLDDDDYPEPYIVTVHKESQKVVRIVARYRERGDQGAYAASIHRAPRSSDQAGALLHQVRLHPGPDGSFYDIGFGTLLAPMSRDHQLHHQPAHGRRPPGQHRAGRVHRLGRAIKSGNLRFQPGEWKKVEVGGALTLRDKRRPAAGQGAVRCCSACSSC